MQKRRLFALMAVLTISIFSSLVAAGETQRYTFVSIDFPGASLTIASEY
jgi:hypothetical protein